MFFSGTLRNMQWHTSIWPVDKKCYNNNINRKRFVALVWTLITHRPNKSICYLRVVCPILKNHCYSWVECSYIKVPSHQIQCKKNITQLFIMTWRFSLSYLRFLFNTLSSMTHSQTHRYTLQTKVIYVVTVKGFIYQCTLKCCMLST